MFHDTQIVISSVGMDHLISSLDMHITKAHRASFLFTVQVWCHHLDVGFKRYQTHYRWFSRLVDCLVCRSSSCCFGNGGLCFVMVVWFHFLTFGVYGEYCNTSVRVFRIYHTSHLFTPLGCEIHLELEGVGGGNKTLVDNYGILEVQNAFPYH